MDTYDEEATDDVSDDTEEVEDSALRMSDEDFLDMSDPFSGDMSSEAGESEAAAVDDTSDEEDISDEEDNEEEDELDEENPSDDDSDSDDEDLADDTDEDSPVSAEEFVAKITQPFKANGREMQVDTPEDAVRLMQMGANYTKKMHAMKPNLKILKTLEKNGLLDENKLNFLIDLDKKNPEAIAKLLKDGSLDPQDFVEDEYGEERKEYAVPDYTVDDAEVRLNEVLTSIEDTDTYDLTMDVVGNKWDAESRQIVADKPELLIVMNDHMASGVHDLISTEVDRARMFGRLEGMTDLQAYQSIGDQMHKKGAFNHLSDGNEKSPKKPAKTPPESKASKEKRNAKKRAASPTKASKSKVDSSNFNPLAMPDEEFLKHEDARFI